MHEHDLPLIVGGGALAAFLWSRVRRDGPDVPVAALAPAPWSPPAAPFTQPLPGRWVWPVPRWRGRKPLVSDGFGSPRPNGQRHEGVDVMFTRAPNDPWRAGSPNGDRNFVMPDDMVALAAADGAIWSAGWTPRGFSVVIDHTPLAPVATYYTHLTKLIVGATERAKSGQRVRAGEAIGIVGADPQDAAHLKHLHFALWRGGPSDAVDPAPIMRGWEYVEDPRQPSPSVAIAMRNAGLVYRPVGTRGDPYPDWLRDVRGKSGVYVIRERDTNGEPVIVYVGTSYSGRLYETLTRHFQEVRHEAQEDPMT